MTTPKEIEENKRIARRYPEEVATERKIELIDELDIANFVEHGPFGQENRGPEADKHQMQEFLAAFPDFEATVKDIIAEGDIVAMRVTLRGTHEGEFMGIEPTGRSFDIQNMVFTRIQDGKIAERWVQPDSLGLMQQLGVIKQPPE